MDQNLKYVVNILNSRQGLTEQQKSAIINTLSRQNRQLEIEAALERVRSRAMAMQTSGELNDLIKTIYIELKKLEASLERCVIMIIDEQTKGMTWWMAGGDDALIEDGFYVQFSQHPWQLAYLKAWEERVEKWQYLIEGQEKQNFDEFVFNETELSKLPPVVIQNMRSFGKIYNSASFSNFGCLLTGSVQPLNDESFNILVRFTKVFDLTYTRFLDLKQAEAQAREAQIELGLERVRARAMAMQNSNELADLVTKVFNELTKLDFALTHCFIWIFDRDTLSGRIWQVNLEIPGKPFTSFIQYHEHPAYLAILKGWKNRDLKWVYKLEGKEKKSWDEFLFNETEYSNLPEVVKEGMQAFEHVVLSASFNNFGALQTAGIEPLSDEQMEILFRFGNVFDMTYTRFNDLKQAEAQAREAQIQLALERVRARTMAMQKSDELTDVAAVLFQQVKDLGIKTWTTGFNVWSDDNNSFTDYITSPKGGFIEPYIVAAPFPALAEARKRGDEFYVFSLEGEILKQVYLELAKFGDKQQYEKMLEGGFEFPERQFNHFVFGSKVSLMFITYEPVPEAHEIFKRFGKVFEQTYTRFLDLQRAEALAREAMIEAGLERVRSRSMAMHKSDEVMDVAVTLYDQLQKLDFKFGATTIIIMDEKTGNMVHWLAGFIQKSHVESYEVNKPEHPLHAAQLGAWRRGEKFVSIELSGSALKGYAEEMFTQTGYKNLPDEEKAMLSAQELAVFNLAYMRHGALMWAPSALSDENASTLR